MRATEIKRGEVWMINLDPTLGHEIKKTRPGIIVQNDIGNTYSPLTIIAPLTSQKTEKIYPFEVFLKKRKGEMRLGSHPFRTRLRFHFLKNWRRKRATGSNQ